MVKEAAFSFDSFLFKKVIIDLKNRDSDEKLSVRFKPSAEFVKGKIYMTIAFSAYNKTRKDPFIETECLALFKFENKEILFSEIPEFFYVNSIAIVFPYIRSFISTITLQANIVPAIILPTFNLTNLSVELKKNMVNRKELK